MDDCFPYRCKECPKQYKTKRGYDNHQVKHVIKPGEAKSCLQEVSAHPISNHDDGENTSEHAALNTAAKNTEQVISFFEEEDEEQEALLLAAMLGCEVGDPAPGGQKEPKAKKVKKPPLAVCSICRAGFQTLDGYIKHRMSHAMNDALSKAPARQVLCVASMDMCKEIACQVFTDNLNAESKLEYQMQSCSCKMKEFVGTQQLQEFLDTLCENLYICFKDSAKFSSPSHLRSAFLKNVSQVLVNQEVKENLKLQLIAALEMGDDDEDVSFFLTAFIRKFANRMLAFIVHHMASTLGKPVSQSEYAVTNQSVDSSEFKELMYYIGGANIKSILRCAWRSWGQNDECKMVISTLRNNFVLTGPDDSSSPDKEFMEWTLCQDRGKLIKINNKALEFFVALAAIVKPLERFDGSLHVEEVIEKVTDNQTFLYLWEDLIQETLSKKVSFKLLFSLCEYFCNTWRRGIVRRRMDELQSKSKVIHGTKGVALRPKVVNFNVKL